MICENQGHETDLVFLDGKSHGEDDIELNSKSVLDTCQNFYKAVEAEHAAGKDSRMLHTVFTTMAHWCLEEQFRTALPFEKRVNVKDDLLEILDLLQNALDLLYKRGFSMDDMSIFTLAQALNGSRRFRESLRVLDYIPKERWSLPIFKVGLRTMLFTCPSQRDEAKKLLTLHDTRSASDENEKSSLWLYYETLLRESRWANCIARYENAKGLSIRNHRHDLDNSMIEVCLTYEEFEFAWQVYENMSHVNSLTILAIITICRRAFAASRLLSAEQDRVDQLILWEGRAWAVYTRFIQSEVHVRFRGIAHILHQILRIAIESLQPESRYAKMLRIYEHFRKLEDKFGRKLKMDAHSVAPFLKLCLKAIGTFGTIDDPSLPAANAQTTIQKSASITADGGVRPTVGLASSCYTKAFEIYGELQKRQPGGAESQTIPATGPADAFYDSPRSSVTDMNAPMFMALLKLLLHNDTPFDNDHFRTIITDLTKQSSFLCDMRILTLVQEIHDRHICASGECRYHQWADQSIKKWVGSADAGDDVDVLATWDGESDANNQEEGVTFDTAALLRSESCDLGDGWSLGKAGQQTKEQTKKLAHVEEIDLSVLSLSDLSKEFSDDEEFELEFDVAGKDLLAEAESRVGAAMEFLNHLLDQTAVY